VDRLPEVLLRELVKNFRWETEDGRPKTGDGRRMTDDGSGKSEVGSGTLRHVERSETSFCMDVENDDGRRMTDDR